MKKTYLPLTDDLTMVSVETDAGDKLEFLNGVMQMNRKNRFVIPADTLHHQYYLVIEDYSWWHVNHFDITDWMREHLPRGEDHCSGMVIHFDTEQQRTWFMLKWQ